MMISFKLILLIIIGLVFLAFGVVLLISSYQQKNPYSFIMSFFAANLVILISAALVFGFILQLARHFKPPKTTDEHIPTDL